MNSTVEAVLTTTLSGLPGILNCTHEQHGRSSAYHKAVWSAGNKGNGQTSGQHVWLQADVLDEAVDPHLQTCVAYLMWLHWTDNFNCLFACLCGVHVSIACLSFCMIVKQPQMIPTTVLPICLDTWHKLCWICSLSQLTSTKTHGRLISTIQPVWYVDTMSCEPQLSAGIIKAMSLLPLDIKYCAAPCTSKYGSVSNDCREKKRLLPDLTIITPSLLINTQCKTLLLTVNDGCDNSYSCDNNYWRYDPQRFSYA